MPARPLTIEQVLAPLTETPQRIAALTDGLTSAQLRSALQQDEWSADDMDVVVYPSYRQRGRWRA